MNRPQIQKIDIPQTVEVRKYKVDTKSLCELLYIQKKNLGFSCEHIAKLLNVPRTKVEHWFRRDDCFAIPDVDVWMELKSLLQIETDKFDESIMTYEERVGVYEKSERHYFADGIAPTITSTSAGNEKIIVEYKENKMDESLNIRKPTSAVVQRIGNIYPSGGQAGNVYDENYCAPCLPGFGAGGGGKELKVLHELRIRKLTPKECFRLMGFDDADFEKAEAVNSNTQLYKQAGNSICVPVVEHIISALIECGALSIEREGCGYGNTKLHCAIDRNKKI